MKTRLKKGDLVKVLIGKDKGKEGKIEKIFYRRAQALIPGLNMAKRHTKPKGEGKPGGIIEVSQPLSLSKLALVCPKCARPGRVSFKLGKDGQKSRFCKKCQQLID